MARADAILSVREVAEIRYYLSQGVQGLILARRHGVSQQTISDIKHYRSWKEVAPLENPSSHSRE